MDKWEGKTVAMVDLTAEESVWLRRTLAKYTESDHAFGIRCKLSDSMRVGEMGIDYEEFTVHPGEAKHVREMAEQVYGHTSQMGVDHKEYAETGTWYYKSAAVSQRLIGVGAVLQALALVGILAILYFKL